MESPARTAVCLMAVAPPLPKKLPPLTTRRLCSPHLQPVKQESLPFINVHPIKWSQSFPDKTSVLPKGNKALSGLQTPINGREPDRLTSNLP